jgi:YfiH family protein
MMSATDFPQPNGSFRWAQAGPAGEPALVCSTLEPVARHIFTTRAWTLGAPSDGAQSGWDEVARAIGAPVARVRQVHGAGVVIRRAGQPADMRAAADADIILSDDPDVAIAVRTADCVPLLFGDSRLGVVAAAHAGWRGLAMRVPYVAVRALEEAFSSRPSDLLVAVGPSISAPRYEVGADVRQAFAASFDTARCSRWFSAGARPDRWQFDGWAAVSDQLEGAGIAPDHIFLSGMCTAAHPAVFCSYRRDGSPAGRMAAAIRASRPRP